MNTPQTKPPTTLDEGANEIVEQAVAAVHAALATVGTDALRSLLHTLLGLAEHVVPNRRHPRYRSSRLHGVYPGHRAVEFNIRDNLGTIRKYADHPPHDKHGYMAMLRELADDEYVIVHLPNGVGKIPVQIRMIDQEIEKLL